MAHATSSTATNQSPKAAPAQFTLTLDTADAQALLALVGHTRGSTLGLLYQSLEDFHEEHGIDRKDVSERHEVRGFDLDRLVDFWAVDESVDA